MQRGSQKPESFGLSGPQAQRARRAPQLIKISEMMVTHTNSYFLMTCSFCPAPYEEPRAPLCSRINKTWAELIRKTAKSSNLTRKTPDFILSSPSSQQSALLHWVGPRQLFQRRASLSTDEQRCLLHQGSIVTHRRCGLVMISRDYGWLMVGKYIKNHQLWKGWWGGIHSH